MQAPQIYAMCTSESVPPTTHSMKDVVRAPNLGRGLPIFLDNINNDPMILMLLQATDNHHCHHTIDALDVDGDRPSVNSIRTSLLPAHAKRRREALLIAIELAVQRPGALAPAEDAVALAGYPVLVVGRDTGAEAAGPSRGGLEDDETAS